MAFDVSKIKVFFVPTIVLCALTLLPSIGTLGTVQAEAIKTADGEVEVRVNPGEPTQVQFPGPISGGVLRKQSPITLQRNGRELILFASEGINESGEAIIVRLEDGRSFALRAKRSTVDRPRDSMLKIEDDRGAIVAATDEEEVYQDKNFQKAPSNQISGLIREMVLVSEFGKKAVPGFQMSDTYKGETVLNDGTVEAKIDHIFIGPSIWGYVIEAQNMLDVGQKLNPASFRLDGTRAVSAQRWELAPRPMNVEQQVSGADRTKIYIVTRAKPTT